MQTESEKLILLFLSFRIFRFWQGLESEDMQLERQQKLSKFTKEIVTINFSTTVISYLLFFIALFAVPRFSEYRALLCICSSTILFSTFGMEWLYNAKEEYVYTTVRGMCFQVLSLILLFVLVKTKDD